MLKSSPIFKRNGAHLVERKTFEKKTKTIHFWGLSVLNMWKHFWFVSNFEHIIFAMNEKYFQKNYDNVNYHASLVIFQTYKNAILKNVHPFGWPLWLCFYLGINFFGSSRIVIRIDLMIFWGLKICQKTQISDYYGPFGW